MKTSVISNQKLVIKKKVITTFVFDTPNDESKNQSISIFITTGGSI